MTHPLLPSQYGFFADVHSQLLNPSKFNLIRYVAFAPSVSLSTVRRAVEAMWRDHQSLRATFVMSDGSWVQQFAAPETPAPFIHIALDDMTDTEIEHFVDRVQTEAEFSLDLANGPLCRWVFFQSRDPSIPSQLLLVAHHLVADAFSMNILVEEFRQNLFRAPDAHRSRPHLFQDCVERLHSYALSDEILSESERWTSLGTGTLARPPSIPHVLSQISAPRTHSINIDVDCNPPALNDRATGLKTSPRKLVLALLGAAVTSYFGGPLYAQVVHDGRILYRDSGRNRETSRRELVLAPDSLDAVGWFATESAVFFPLLDREPTEYLQKLELVNPFVNDGYGFGALRHVSAVSTFERELFIPERGPQIWINHISEPISGGSEPVWAPHKNKNPYGPASDPMFVGTPLAIDVSSGRRGILIRVTGDLAHYDLADINRVAESVQAKAVHFLLDIPVT